MTQPDYDTYRKSMDAQNGAGKDSPDDEHFTAEEIAAFLNIPVDEFFSRAAHGDLKPVEINDKHLYAGKQVRRFLINLGVLEGEDEW